MLSQNAKSAGEVQKPVKKIQSATPDKVFPNVDQLGGLLPISPIVGVFQRKLSFSRGLSCSARCAAASRAAGTRKGEQLT